MQNQESFDFAQVNSIRNDFFPDGRWKKNVEKYLHFVITTRKEFKKLK